MLLPIPSSKLQLHNFSTYTSSPPQKHHLISCQNDLQTTEARMPNLTSESLNKFGKIWILLLQVLLPLPHSKLQRRNFSPHTPSPAQKKQNHVLQSSTRMLDLTSELCCSCCCHCQAPNFSVGTSPHAPPCHPKTAPNFVPQRRSKMQGQNTQPQV